ncbi:hypothetical protein [Tenacibaculum piscium]|uniref:hypothetical protein n=1 Tax=Tenacibaculum piscium TaxID=1458515 RepID=UPI001F43111E|nr:hypothetical protein [Tenacibaculum piscium]
MLRYNLGSSGAVGRPSQDYMSSVTGGSYTTPVSTATDFIKKGDFETSDFLNLVSPAADALFPGGSQVVSIVSGLFAKDDWETKVKPVFEDRAKVIMEYMVNTYLKNRSLPELERVNLFDAYVSAFLFHQYKHVDHYKHSNSQQATKLVADIIQVFLDGFRSEFATRYDVSDKTSDVRNWGFKSYSGDSFSFKYGSLIPHKVYSVKNVETVAAKKDAIVPFNPDSSGGSAESEKDNDFVKKYWWLLFIPVILYAVYKGFDLNNNKKKRR